MSNGVSRRRVIVQGRVQGVFFRDATRREADRHGVAGWAQNRADGSVEAVFEGPSEAVERMVEFCRKGPGQASVSDIETFTEEPQQLSGFDIR